MERRELARALFAPRSVALIGASGDPAKNTARPQRFLRKHGYAGRVIPINPIRDEVLGEKAWPDITAAPGPIDHAFIMTPADSVPRVVADCCRAGVKVASIYSDGFAESGEEGLRKQRDLVEQARSGGLRLVGPNSMGVVNTHGHAPITVSAALELPELAAGGLSVVSQSGTMLGALISRGQARGMGFAKLVSIGNEADLTVGEVGDLLVDDPETRAIILFLESIRNPKTLGAMARRAFDAGKPVIVYKLGRSEVGRRLAVSHSGALAGPDEAATAFFRHHGIIRVGMMETLFEIAPMVVGRKPGAGKRVAVLTTTGGGAATVVDRLGALDINLVPATDGLKARLQPFGVRLGDSPLIDLTMAGARKEVFGAAIEELIATPDCDAVVAVVGSSAQFHPEVAVEPIVDAAGSDKPVAVFLVPQADRSLALLSEAGIAAFRTPESCADALRAYFDWSPPAQPAPAVRDLARAEAILVGAGGAALDETDTRAVFEALGIAQAPANRIADPSEGSRVGYPIAVKVASRDIAHKTDVGGVVLNVADVEGLRAACEKIRANVRQSHPGAQIDGFTVQRMERGLAEALIGYRVNPETGPVVMVGVGSALAELHRDVAVRLAPVDEATALEMIEEVTGLASIRGYRSLPRGDCTALAAAISALSDFARITTARVLEAEINPLIVKADGVVAVDGLIVIAQAASK